MDKKKLDEILAAGEALGYVTYDANGVLDGSYWQLPPPDHYDRMILVPDNYKRQWWYNYKPNDTFDDLVEIPYVPPKPKIEDYTMSVQILMDQKVAERRYDGILQACTYALSTDAQFKAEGEACVRWRDAVWRYCYEQFEKFQSGQIEQPSVADLVASLPTMEWPVDADSETPVQSEG